VPAKKEPPAAEAATEHKQGWNQVFKFNSGKEKRLENDPALGET